MMGTGTFLVLDHVGDHLGERPTPAAAVYVEAGPAGGYFGMLSVSPALQGMGLGTRLVRMPRRCARRWARRRCGCAS